MNNPFPKISTKFYPGDWVYKAGQGDGIVVGVHPNGKILVKFSTIIQTVEVSDCEYLKSRGNA